MKDLDKLLADHINDIRKDLNFIYNCRMKHIMERGEMKEINKEIENWKDIIKNSYEIKISYYEYNYKALPSPSLMTRLLIAGLKIFLVIQQIKNLGETIKEYRNRSVTKQKENTKDLEITEKYKNPLEPSENIEYDITYDRLCYYNRIGRVISAMEEIIKESGFKLGRKDYKLEVEINYKGEKISENPKINIERGKNYLLYIEKDIDSNYELSIKLSKERYNK
jgi:hypothetical protein